jgi:hypothetical protein
MKAMKALQTDIAVPLNYELPNCCTDKPCICRDSNPAGDLIGATTAAPLDEPAND